MYKRQLSECGCGVRGVARECLFVRKGTLRFTTQRSHMLRDSCKVGACTGRAGRKHKRVGRAYHILRLQGNAELLSSHEQYLQESAHCGGIVRPAHAGNSIDQTTPRLRLSSYSLGDVCTDALACGTWRVPECELAQSPIQQLPRVSSKQGTDILASTGQY